MASKKKASPSAKGGSPVEKLLKAATGDARDAAQFAVRKSLHVGGVVQAAAPALVAALLDGLARDPAAFAGLQLVADAVSAGDVRQLGTPKTPAKGPVDAVRKAIEAQASLIVGALRHDDPRVRAAAARVFAFVPSLPAAALDACVASEADDDVLFSAAFASFVRLSLAKLGSASSALSTARQSSKRAVRAASALGSLLDAGEASGLQELTPFLDPFRPQTMPWGQGELGDLVIAIARARKCNGAVATGLLECEKLPTGLGDVFLDLGDFKQSFKEIEVALVEALSQTQREIALGLAKHAGVRGLGWGLPSSVRDRRRWLGVAPPGVLEKVLDAKAAGAKRPLPVWKVWLDGVARATAVVVPKPIEAALDADAMLEAYGEILTLAYNIGANRLNVTDDQLLALAPSLNGRSFGWARTYWSELSGYFAARSSPELGNVVGIPGAPAVFLAWLSSKESLPDDLLAFFPAPRLKLAKHLLERLGSKVGEEALFRWVCRPDFADRGDFVVSTAERLLGIVSSKRIVDHLGKVVDGLADDLDPADLKELRASLRKHR